MGGARDGTRPDEAGRESILYRISAADFRREKPGG
jgi:hypothetical protein